MLYLYCNLPTKGNDMNNNNNGKAVAIKELQRRQGVFEEEQVKQGKQLAVLNERVRTIDDKVNMIADVNAVNHDELKMLLKERATKCDIICRKHQETIDAIRSNLTNIDKEHTINEIELSKKIERVGWVQKIFNTVFGKILAFLITSGAVTAIIKVVWDFFKGI